jgi:CRISPR-associated endonuclease/helicase Cas3
MSEKLNCRFMWGKTDRSDSKRWNPLILHLIDVAASADALLRREPESTRQRMGALLGLSWEEALPWLLVLIACHDLGKACPGFQCKWEESKSLIEKMGLRILPNPNTSIKHGFVSQVALELLLKEQDWPATLTRTVADAVGCHHGERASPIEIEFLEGDRKALGDSGWTRMRQGIFDQLLELFKPLAKPTKRSLDGPDFMLLAGLTSFADWIGSNEEWFPFGTPDDVADLDNWWNQALEKAEVALEALGWHQRLPLRNIGASFEEVFNQHPRPLQEAVSAEVQKATEPTVILIEAPMGEGKTEAALYAHLELQRRLGHRGLYIALPTKATGNAMFKRVLHFLNSHSAGRHIDLQLLHGATQLNDEFQKLRLTAIDGFDEVGKVRAAEWFTHKKRALLSEYGVGTIDQSLLSILPVRHQFIRLWGLANRVVVFDEIHAYDAYTGTLLVELVRWLLALGSSVILLSATLPPRIRQKLADACGTRIDDVEAPYPRISLFSEGRMKQVAFQADPTRRCSIKIVEVEPDLKSIVEEMAIQLPVEGMGLIIVNTVQRAQELYQLYQEGVAIIFKSEVIGKRLADNTEIFLFHARYPANLRQIREDGVLSIFGKEGTRSGRTILIATQVVEQSLDLDFDYMITDLAPIDLILQRAGRLWRHPRSSRPVSCPTLAITGLSGDAPISFGNPLWWDAIYREDILLRTWELLKAKTEINLPDQIDSLVEDVYEELREMPLHLQERLDKALEESEGKAIAEKGRAQRAIIGSPHGSSWQKQCFSKHEDDEINCHPDLMARTRLGDSSVSIIPLNSSERDLVAAVPSFLQAKTWSQQAINVSKKRIVMVMQILGVPEFWQKSPLLRNCYPFWIDEAGCWLEDTRIRLDGELGLVYETKEDI